MPPARSTRPHNAPAHPARAAAFAKASADKPRPAHPPSPRLRRTSRAPRTPRAPRAAGATRAAVFAAAAELFSARGFDGVVVDDIAERARVNKAMIYYHFADKLALYREVVGDMLRAAGARVSAIAAQPDPPAARLGAFIAAFVQLADERPWFPTMMLREMAEGAPHLDAATLGLMRGVFAAFATILADGHDAGSFRQVHPVMAYLSIIGPILLNAARERAAAAPGRRRMPMFVDLPHTDLAVHMQQAALRILSKG
jgi:AcrR family transcriptional regulator